MALGDMDDERRQMVMGALGVGAQFGVLLPFSREHESEADNMGLIYAARACFDPTEAPRLWERMGKPAQAALQLNSRRLIPVMKPASSSSRTGCPKRLRSGSKSASVEKNETAKILKERFYVRRTSHRNHIIFVQEFR